MKEQTCSDCGSAMEEGVPFHWQSSIWNLFAMPLMWSRGTFESVAFRPIKKNAGNLLMIKSLRCTECGLVKTYALPMKK